MENSRIEQIRAFLKESPNDNFLNYALALEFVGRGAVEEAEQIFANLIQTQPGYSATYYQYGKLLLSQNLKEKAREIFESGIKIAVENKETHTAAELRTALNELLYDEE